MQRINVTFVLKGMRRSPICLNVSMFVRIIRDPASSTEEVSIRVFYKSLQIAFPNNVAAEVYSLLGTPRKREAWSAELINI